MFSLTRFVSLFLGVHGVGDTTVNAGQCVGLVEKWLNANGKPHVWGDAKDLLANADRLVFHVTANTPQNYPPAGAVVVWDSTWGEGHGHCAVVVGANVNRLAVYEQNNPTGAAPCVGNHDYSHVVGWLTW